MASPDSDPSTEDTLRVLAVVKLYSSTCQLPLLPMQKKQREGALMVEEMGEKERKGHCIVCTRPMESCYVESVLCADCRQVPNLLLG